MISDILQLKQIVISPMTPHVGRRRINDEQMPARFPAGTLARIDAVLVAGEKRADLLRKAVEGEIERRQKTADRDTPADGRRRARGKR
jgi:hypothetical protein